MTLSVANARANVGLLFSGAPGFPELGKADILGLSLHRCAYVLSLIIILEPPYSSLLCLTSFPRSRLILIQALLGLIMGLTPLYFITSERRVPRHLLFYLIP
jgi:hypothetical protein